MAGFAWSTGIHKNHRVTLKGPDGVWLSGMAYFEAANDVLDFVMGTVIGLQGDQSPDLSVMNA